MDVRNAASNLRHNRMFY